MPPVRDDKKVRATGGQVDAMVLALLEAAFDKDAEVREVIGTSLYDLGRRQPLLMLSSCCSYLAKNQKLSNGHRVVILNAMERTIKLTIDNLDRDLGVEVIKRAVTELTQSKDVVPDWQTSASQVLVAVGVKYCNEVMEQLLENFQPGVLPHFFVVQTLASLATANVYGMVPYLKVCLGTMLPMLGMAKQDNLRWVLSTAFARFSEAILDYTANIDKAPDPNVRKECFEAEISSAWDVLFNVWLGSRESKLRSVVIEALGHMSYILSPTRLQESLPKLLPAILGLYKKHQEPYNVTVGLYMILDAASQPDSKMLEPFLETLLSTLFPLICVTVDYSIQTSFKNHNELLRCFTALVHVFADKIIAFLLTKLEQTTDKVRVGVLDLVRHLVNSSGSYLEGKEDLVLSGLKPLLTDNSNKVKKSFASTIITMGHHRYLELEGGQMMIEFIVRQCALPQDPPGVVGGKRGSTANAADVESSNEDLRSMCANVLHLLSTTIPHMDKVLWPYLLELLMPEQYTDAVGFLCKAIGAIAARKKQQNDADYTIDFDVFVETPKPPEILARLIVLIGHPMHGSGRGIHVLNCLQLLSSIINENCVDLWNQVLPKLVKHLEENIAKESVWSQKHWEDLVLKFLSKTLEQINDDVWITQCGDNLIKHFPLYNNTPEEKNFLFKCIGVVARKSNKKDQVNKLLDAVFSTVRHSSELDREGCAASVGFAAASHLDTVLSKLETVSRADAKKSSGFLNFFKDSAGDSEEKVKATLVLSYGYVTLFAPPELIQSRLEANILRTINPLFTQVKDRAVKQSLIKSVELIGEAMHPDHLKTSFSFSHRNSLLQHMQSYIKVESPTVLGSETRAMAMKTCATLAKLDPKLTAAELQDLMKLFLFSTMSLPAEPLTQSTEEYNLQKEMLDKTMKALSEVIKELLIKDTTVATFDLIHQSLVIWMKSTQEVERLRSIDILLELLMLFYSRLDVVKCGHFGALGTVMAGLVPRCSDPKVEVRQSAFDCVETLLRIAAKYDGKEDTVDQFIEAVPTLREKINKSDSNVMFSVINDLAKVFNKKVAPDFLMSFLEGLIDGLLDAQPYSSSGSCVVINSMLKVRGGELHSQVEKIYILLYNKLSEISNPQTKTGTLRAIRTLSSHHLLKVISLLLEDQLPFSDNTIEIWRMIGQDQQLSSTVIDQLLEILTRSLPYEELPESSSKANDRPPRRAMHTPLAIVCAITELSRSEESQVAVMNSYPRLLAAMLIQTASATGSRPPKVEKEKKDELKVKRIFAAASDTKVIPSNITIEGLKQIIHSSRSDKFFAALENCSCWTMLTDETLCSDGFTQLAKLMVETQPEFVPKMINHLNPVLSGLYWPQRAMAAAIFAELWLLDILSQLINQRCGSDMVLVEMLVQSLLGRLVDSDRTVRMLCIRGLGNIASTGRAQVQKYCTMVLSAMMSGMDDKEDTDDVITLEAMTGLSKIIAQVSDTDIQPILINVALRIRPCFEKEKPAIRAASFTLFGDLSAFGEGPSKEQFLEQIHTNLVSLLLHINDKDPNVKHACKTSLKRLGPLLGAEVVQNIFQNHLGTGSLHYGEFMNFLSKAIIQDLPDRINHYVLNNVMFFKSSSVEIRCNAAVFVGFLLGNLPAERSSDVSKEHVCTALISLLKDSETSVRIAAASAIGLLTNI